MGLLQGADNTELVHFKEKFCNRFVVTAIVCKHLSCNDVIVVPCQRMLHVQWLSSGTEASKLVAVAINL
jgi:hypothetical protein